MFGFNFNKVFFGFLVGFFLINLLNYQNSSVPLTWKILIFGLAFASVSLLSLSSDFLAELEEKKL